VRAKMVAYKNSTNSLRGSHVPLRLLFFPIFSWPDQDVLVMKFPGLRLGIWIWLVRYILYTPNLSYPDHVADWLEWSERGMSARHAV